VIGDPVEHSLSPALHGAVFETLGLEAVYEKVRVPPGALEDFAGKNSLRGYNVTIPHKESIIPFLDEVSGEARLAGAVNTVVREGGRQIGYNTDMEGLLRALRGNGTEYRDRVVCVFGTGGAARGVVCKAALEGAGEIRIFGRNGAKAAGIVRAAAGQGDPYRKEPLFRGLPSPEGVRGADIFINATPLGMAGFGEDFSSPGVSRQGVSTAFLEGLPDKALVYDCVYTPGETTLVKAARDRGLRAENGLSMLVWQGLLAEVFFGLADREAMLTKELYRAVYDRLEKLLYAPKGNKEEVNDPAKEKA
jgi:shikimate dehydrogenase